MFLSVTRRPLSFPSMTRRPLSFNLRRASGSSRAVEAPVR
jgi:hypothetical protein